MPPNETTRQEVLDAEFERSFAAEGLRRVRFTSPQERRALEESYARRMSERFDADLVVLASVGELSGADWLNARLYLRSGYLNRQGLVRLEANRANALGRYLATGKDVPGVLKPEEAGALVAAARSAPQAKEPSIEPLVHRHRRLELPRRGPGVVRHRPVGQRQGRREAATGRHHPRRLREADQRSTARPRAPTSGAAWPASAACCWPRPA